MAEKQKVVIFESTDRGATKVFDNEGLVLEFERQNINLVRNANGELIRTNKSDSWICATEDKDLIERAKKHPKFDVEFKIIKKIPKSNDVSIVVTAGAEAVNADITEAIRFGELKSKLLKTDGSYVKNADEKEIAEYESLKEDFPAE